MDTKVYLLNVPLESDQKHTLHFTSKEQQRAYFESRIVKSYINSTYQRKDSIIRVPDNYDNISPSVNYVMYQNPSFSNKWFYAFIKEVEYKNTETTWIHIETDVIQTWLFDYNVKTSFVEREHVNDDTVGLHTVPEGLETGDYIVNSTNKNTALTDSVVIMASTIDPVIEKDGDEYKLIGGNNGGGIYNGVRSGYGYYTFTKESSSSLSNVLRAFAKAGKNDAIGMMFIAPKKLIQISDETYDNAMVKESNLPTAFTWGDGDNDTPNYKLKELNGYKPRNAKLLTYPYCYMNLSNNNGGNAIYKYELFKNGAGTDECIIDIMGALTPSMDIMAVPYNYNGSNGSNYNEALTGGKYPICGWNSDVYTNWLTQNAVNIAISGLSAGAQIVSGVAMIGTGAGAGAGASMIGNGGLSIASTLGEMYQHAKVPTQAEGSVNGGNVKYATNNTTFTVYNMSIKKEFAEIIDGYFDMFGYKVNKIKVPNKAHRSRYWYIKTIDVNIDGAIPNNDMQKIKDCYNNGITFWRNANEIQDYSLSNGIV